MRQWTEVRAQLLSQSGQYQLGNPHPMGENESNGGSGHQGNRADVTLSEVPM